MTPPQRPPSSLPPAAQRRAWWQAFWPHPMAVTAREQARVVLGASLGIALSGALSWWASQWLGLSALWLIAPMGASAVLIFGVTTSPMAQPWSVVAGHVISTLLGVACARWLHWPIVASAVAVGSAMAAMFALRCLHPPAGGTALMMTLGGITQAQWVLFPVAFNALALVAAGVLFHYVTRHPYPQRSGSGSGENSLEADLDAVLKRHNQILDISREELQSLLHETQLQAYQHKLEQLRCADIMSRQLVTVSYDTAQTQAWALLQERHIKALPVVDKDQRLVGIVTQADFLRAGHWPSASHSSTDTVAAIMTRQVRVASEQRLLAQLIPLFGSTGHHHIPVIDAQQRLVGIITQTDVVAALCRPLA